MKVPSLSSGCEIAQFFVRYMAGGVRPSRTPSQTVETHHETTAPAFIRKVALQFLLDIPLTLN
jgi:hypothetical protein